jgi:hypothetical protein
MYCIFITPLSAQSRAACMPSLLSIFVWRKKDAYLLFPWNELTLIEDSGHVSW